MRRSSPVRVSRRSLVLPTAAILAFLVLRPAGAVHESTNTLVFAPVPGSPAPTATGTGVVDFRGEPEPESKWVATFRFAGLAPATAYAVAVQGRFGADGSAEADAFTEVCAFRTGDDGAGGCWYYVRAMRRLGAAQLRLDGADGPPVLQATRAPGGPGSITSQPNRFSPSPVASPLASPAATPASPVSR